MNIQLNNKIHSKTKFPVRFWEIINSSFLRTTLLLKNLMKKCNNILKLTITKQSLMINKLHLMIWQD